MIIIETTQALMLVVSALTVFGIIFMQVLACEEATKELSASIWDDNKPILPEKHTPLTFAQMMPKEV